MSGNDWWTTISAYPDFVSSSSDYVFYNNLETKWMGLDLAVDNPTITCYNGTDGICTILDDTQITNNLTVLGNITSDGYICDSTGCIGEGGSSLWTNNSGVAQYIGGVVHGYMPNATDNYSIMVSEGEGAFAGGMAEGGYYELIPAFLSCGKYSTINASGNGSIAWGYAPERIESSCPYGFGQLQNGILSSGKGSLAGGTPVGDVNYINGSGDGSFTWGVGDQRNTHSGGTNIGRGNQVVGTGKTTGIGIGTSNLVNESYATGIGFSNQLRAGSTFSSAVGYLNTISSQYSYAFGSGNQIVNPAHQYITLLGTNMFSSGYNQVRLGVNNYGITINTTAIYMNQTMVLEPNGTGATCNSGLAGSIYYDGGTNKHRGCDGTTWNDLY